MAKKKSSLPRKDTIQPLDVFLHAVHFDYTARHLERLGLRHLAALPPGKRTVAPVAGTVVTSVVKDLADLPPTWVPMLVNSLFSTELFLKTILVLETGKKPPHGHELADLFSKVSGNGRSRIETLFREYHARDQVALATGREPELVPLLKSHDTAFADLRYSYELAAGWDVNSLTAVRNALLTHCVDVNPPWAVEVLKAGVLPT